MDSVVEEKKTAAPKQESFRDTVSTIDKDGKRVWLFPQKPKGRFYNMRNALTWVYLVVFFALPFIKVNGDPLFLFNVVERKFILFGMIFWPQDFFLFGLGLLIFIVFIALFTVVYGRVFCGWACPQTIFMEMIFRRVEFWIEGDANHQRALDRQKWNSEKVLKRSAKFAAFFAISFLITNTMYSYIIGADSLIKIISEPISLHAGGFIGIMVFTGIFFAVYSWFREQVCLIVCPYGRMQGVLLDKNSIVVAYDHERGEPRHKFRKEETTEKGDCIDCFQCVKVCPTGIDIRNGTQLECINCTACIDACDHMMEAVKRPKGLIRFASENQITERKKFRFTGRMKAYTAILVLLIALEVFLVAGRSDVDVTILRAKGMLYQEQPDNRISNLYSVKLLNKTREDMPLHIKVENLPASVQIIGNGLHVKKEGMATGEFFVIVDKKSLNDRKTKIEIGLYSGEKKIKTIKTNFLGPVMLNNKH